MTSDISKYDSIILAGGLGTRVRDILPQKTAKIMFRIDEVPFLDYQISYLYSFGIKKIILALGYGSEGIIEYLSEKKYPKDLIIHYVVEKSPLGTAGALTLCSKYVRSPNIFVLNGDTLTSCSLKELLMYHIDKKAYATMNIIKQSSTQNYGNVTFNSNHEILNFHEKPDEHSTSNFINSGLYLLKKNIIDNLSRNTYISIENDVFPKLVGQKFFAYVCDSDFIDIGNLNTVDESIDKLRKISLFSIKG